IRLRLRERATRCCRARELGEGCVARTPSPIRIRGSTFVPSPAPNSGLPEFGTLSRPKSDKSDFGWARAQQASAVHFGETTQRTRLGSSPRGAPRDACVAGTPWRGPITMVFGYGSRLSTRFAGVGRDDDLFIKNEEPPAAVGNDRWFALPVSGLFFTGTDATPA